MMTKQLNMNPLASFSTEAAHDLRAKESLGKINAVTSKKSNSSIADAATTQKNAEIRQLSEEFEALFLGMVLKSMRDSVQKSGLIDGGNAENIYRSMLDDEYAKQMATQHHTGLADKIAEFLIGQNQSRGQQAYDKQGLPDPQKQATIGIEEKSASVKSN